MRFIPSGSEEPWANEPETFFMPPSPRKIGERVGVRGRETIPETHSPSPTFHRRPDRQDHALDIRQHIDVGEPDDPVSIRLKKCGAACIVCKGLFGHALSTIQFYRQSVFKIGETKDPKGVGCWCLEQNAEPCIATSISLTKFRIRALSFPFV